MVIKPILFNGEMVDAIQAGRKTVTRRLIRWERDQILKVAQARGKLFDHVDEGEPIPEQLLTGYIDRVLPRPVKVGDLLWVRETWAFWPCITCRSEAEHCEIHPDQMETADGLTDGCFLYRADGENPVFPLGHIWRPSIHMPKAAARIFLRVTEVFPERLQESINEAEVPMMEIYREGVKISEECKTCREAYGRPCCIDDESECGNLDEQRGEFADLWDSTVRKDKLSSDGWAADPWVWVIRFERCERPEGWPE